MATGCGCVGVAQMQLKVCSMCVGVHISLHNTVAYIHAQQEKHGYNKLWQLNSLAIT